MYKVTVHGGLTLTFDTDEKIHKAIDRWINMAKGWGSEYAQERHHCLKVAADLILFLDRIDAHRYSCLMCKLNLNSISVISHE